MIEIKPATIRGDHEWCTLCDKQINTKRIKFSRDGRSGVSIVLCRDCRKQLSNTLLTEEANESEEKEPPENTPQRVSYLKITDADIERAEQAHKNHRGFLYIDGLRFEIIKRYLTHFEGPEYILPEILRENMVRDIVSKDKELSFYNDPEKTIPESFNEVCDYITSI